MWIGLTYKYHPAQVLADLMTIQENIKKPLEKVIFAYIDDGRNNMVNSLLIVGSIMSMEVRIISPKSLFPAKKLTKETEKFAKDSEAKIIITDDLNRRGKKSRCFLYRCLGINGRRRIFFRTDKIAKRLSGEYGSN